MTQITAGQILVNILCTIAFGAFLLIFFMLSELSKRLGEAMHIPAYYRLYYISMVLVFMGIMARIISLVSESESFSHAIGYVFFSIGITIAFIVTYKYWGWIIPAIRE